jgi:diacylglycerol kinase (CTP)
VKDMVTILETITERTSPSLGRSRATSPMGSQRMVESEMPALKKRSDIHWARKIWHMAGVSAMALAFAFLPTNVSYTLLAVAILIFIPLDFMRQTRPKLNDWMIHAFRAIIRKNEVNKLAGTTYLLAGTGLVVVLFDAKIVLLTLMYLAFADPIASFVGIRYGKDKIFGHKSLQGFLAAFAVCTLLTLGYLYYHSILIDHLWMVSLLAGLSGALAELIPVAKLDDNFTLPVISATCLWILFTIFGGMPV